MLTTTINPEICAQDCADNIRRLDVTFISDVGHPHFPGWELLTLLLICATILANINGHLDPRGFRPPRLRQTISRVVRKEG